MRKSLPAFLLMLCACFLSQAQTNPAAFITTWQTTTANESITIPINLNVSGNNYTVDMSPAGKIHFFCI